MPKFTLMLVIFGEAFRNAVSLFFIRDIIGIPTIGAAYFFYFMELMEKNAIEMGLNKEDAHLLTIETALGAAKMALLSSYEPTTLRKQVSSPGGTTEQALNIFIQGKLDKLVRSAMDAAKRRSVELSESFKD